MNDNNNLFDFSNLLNTNDSNHVDISSIPHDPVVLRSPPQTMTVSADSSDALQQFMNNGSYDQQIITPSTELNQGFDLSNSVNLQSDDIHHQTINNHSMIMSHVPKPVHLNSDSQEVSVHSDKINNDLEISDFNQFNGLNNLADHTVVMRSSSSTHCSPYTTIENDGMVYKHTSDNPSDSYYAGYVSDRSIYNPSHHYQGYGGTDGKIYDHHNHCVGWVNSCGDVFNTAGVQVYHTTKGVVGGAAYMLLVYHGGVS